MSVGIYSNTQIYSRCLIATDNPSECQNPPTLFFMKNMGAVTLENIHVY
jgi:hypothetical protein